MPLDPVVKAMLDQMAASGAPPLSGLPPVQARESFNTMIAAMRTTTTLVARCEDRVIPGPAGEIAVRVYTPEGNGPFPVLVFFHGGGWVLGNLDSHDETCRILTNATGALTIAVDYRLAPEHKFPAAAEDCYAAAKWAAENASSLGGDGGRLAVGGDSAGGNLSAAVAQMARDRGGPHLCHQLLLYPAIDPACDTRSQKALAEGYLLSRADMFWFWNHYLRGEQDRANPYANPARAQNFRGLAPATVITAEFDPLRDEGEAYAARMREAGVPLVCTRYDGVIHGFFGMSAVLEQARQAVAQAADRLRESFKA
jgi:acetyl esterase